MAIFLALLGFQFFKDLAVSLKEKTLSGELARLEHKSAPKDPWAKMTVEAKSAIVWDARDNRVLYAKNERAQLPLASLVKIMSVYVALEAGNTVATVSREAISEEGDSGLLVGEKWRVPDLAKLTLVSSANDGAESLAAAWVGFEKDRAGGSESSFVQAMNDRAKALNLPQTYFLNETGLDVSAKAAGGYGSAEDMARLFYQALSAYPAIFEVTGRPELKIESMNGKVHSVLNTNGDVRKIPGLITSKTGFTALAGGNLAVVFDAGLNHPVVAVVLGSSFQGRFSDVEKLAVKAIEAVGYGGGKDVY